MPSNARLLLQNPFKSCNFADWSPMTKQYKEREMEHSILAIVVPCFNEEEVLPRTNRELLSLLNDMIGKQQVSPMSYILYVDDGSRDSTWNLIDSYSQGDSHIRGLKLAGNVGHQNALMAGLVPLLGYRSDTVYYDRLERQAGESKYPLSKMLSFAIDGITSFSVKPLRLIFALGSVFLLISFAILIYVIVALCRGNGVQGWASLMLSIWFVGGCVLICLSVIAAYIGRIYTESKHRPRYNIEKYIGGAKDRV